MIEGTTIPGAKRLPVVLAGAWKSPARLSWEGGATCSEPMVAVAFLRCGHHVDWGLSCRSDSPTIETGILFACREADRFVQVNFSINGGGLRWTSLLPSSTYRPIIPANSRLETGTVGIIARVEGEPIIDLLGLFIAKTDTIGGRNRIWHLRPQYHDRLPPVLKRPLTYGRSGEFDDLNCEPTAAASPTVDR